MLIVWLVFTFGLSTQPKTIIADTTHAAIIATLPTTSVDSSGIQGDLENAETNDAKKLEIIKQIRRVNSDGSFVLGYEAVDGTFKIESRDVLGNVKGTYGYVDENGEIKRVSYTANNTKIGSKSVPHQIVHIPRGNKTVVSSTINQRSSLVGSSKPTSARTHSNIIAIPKRRSLHASSTEASKYQFSSITPMFKKIGQDQKSEQTTTIVYATSTLSETTPSTMSSTSESVSRMNKIEINDSFSKVFNVHKSSKVLNNPSEQTDEKSERRPVRGNMLRRQLSDDQNEHFRNPQVVYSQSSDEDSVHGTQRPTFTTTSSPRIPHLVLVARSRAAMLKNAALQNSNPIEKTFSKTSRRKPDRTDDNSSSLEPSSENEYPTQNPIAVQIPPNKESTQIENGQTYRQSNIYIPKSNENMRGTTSIQRQYKLPIQSNVLQREGESEQYLRESPEPNVKDPSSSSLDLYANNDGNAETNPILQSFYPNYQNKFGPQQNFRHDNDQRFQQFPLPMQPYQTLLRGANPPYQSHLDRPLTAKDFEGLLNLLVLRHQQHQRLGYSLGQNLIAGFNGYYGGNPYYQVHRPPFYNQFDPRYTAFSRSLPPVPPPHSFYAPYSEQENQYQAQNPIEQQLPYLGLPLQSRRHFNNKPYLNDYDKSNSNHFPHKKIHDNTEYLPSDIREELLYKLLMLSIQSDIGLTMGNIPIPDASIMKIESISTSEEGSKKPIRSVQILGEE